MILAQMILAQMTLTQIEPVLALQDAQHTDPNFGYHPPQSPQTAAGNVRPKSGSALAVQPCSTATASLPPNRRIFNLPATINGQTAKFLGIRQSINPDIDPDKSIFINFLKPIKPPDLEQLLGTR